jgi:MerR family transcriptional regulator/heat shock protein HspR
MTAKDKPVYMISVVAQMLDVHPQTLRLYEREGLVQPSRTDGNTRLYSQEDVERVEKVLNLTRDLGVNLAGVDIILRLQQRLESLESERNKYLSDFIKYVEKQLSRRRTDDSLWVDHQPSPLRRQNIEMMEVPVHQNWTVILRKEILHRTFHAFH